MKLRPPSVFAVAEFTGLWSHIIEAAERGRPIRRADLAGLMRDAARLGIFPKSVGEQIVGIIDPPSGRKKRPRRWSGEELYFQKLAMQLYDNIYPLVECGRDAEQYGNQASNEFMLRLNTDLNERSRGESRADVARRATLAILNKLYRVPANNTAVMTDEKLKHLIRERKARRRSTPR